MDPADIVSRAERVAGDIQARGNHLCLEYAGVSTAYHSDADAAASEWIEEFFGGYFTPSGGTDGDVTVYSTGDSALLASLQRWAAAQSAPAEKDSAEIPFTDSVALVRKQTGKAPRQEEVYLLLFKEQRRIVLVTSADLETQREAAMQTLRAATKWLLLERGWFPMHSACAAKDGRAICVAGEKAAGKTSTLLNLLARNGCDLLAVDKFLIRDGGAHLEVCGTPGKIGIRVGTAIVQPRVLDWLAQERAPFFPHLSLDDVRQIAATNTASQLRNRPEKISMLPAELATLFRRSITPVAPLGLLLIPVFDLDIEEARLVRVDPEQAFGMLMKGYVSLLSKGEGFLLHFFDLSDALLEERLAVLLRRYLPDVAAYELHQNHETNEQAAKLIAGLL